MKAFFNECEMKDITKFARKLASKNGVEETDFIESGGLRVEVDAVSKKEICFSVYRMIAYGTTKKIKEEAKTD